MAQASSSSSNYDPQSSADERRGLLLLSSREAEIVCLLRQGDRVPLIARRLWLTQGTVRNHLYSIYRKVGVKSQQELVGLLRNLTEPGHVPYAR